mgnify:CR=1 FL=1
MALGTFYVCSGMGGSTFGRSEARCDEDEGCLPDVIEKEKDERQKQRS